jgi:hypothetical protein
MFSYNVGAYVMSNMLTVLMDSDLILSVLYDIKRLKIGGSMYPIKLW